MLVSSLVRSRRSTAGYTVVHLRRRPRRHRRGRCRCGARCRTPTGARSPRSTAPSASTASRCSSRWSSRAAVILAALLADDYLRREGLEGVELYVLLLLSAAGGVVMAQANDLIVLFLGLEMLSIAVYVLAAMHLPPGHVAGGRHQVLRARRVLVGLLPLRHRHGLRRAPARPTSSTIIELFSTDDVLTERRPAARRPRAACSSASASRSRRCRSTSWTPDVYQGVARRRRWPSWPPP